MSFLSFLQPKPCMECGYDPVFHRLERWSIVVDAMTSRVFRPIAGLSRLLTPLVGVLIDFVTYPIARCAVFFGIANIVRGPDGQASESAIALWEEADVRGIEMYEIRFFGLPRRLFGASFKGRRIVFEGLPRPNRIQPSLEWLDNKEKMKKRFLRAGFPVARGKACRTISQARKVLSEVSPVITKPHIGSGGRHTRAHISTDDELVHGFLSAKRLSPLVMVEEELIGPVFRATLIEGKLVAVLRRDPPQVVGDGVSTVRALVEGENKNPLRKGPVFAEISLTVPGVDYERIPKKDEVVMFHFKVNWGVGGTSRDATTQTHSDNAKLFKDIGAYLGDDIVGIDFMIGDITKSWKEQKRCGVIECNSLPHIGNHHFPFTGPVVPVAGFIWDMVYPQSKPV